MRWRGIQKFNVIEANEYRGLLGQPLGKKFHVNGLTGSDGYTGESKKSPMKTIAAALARCVNDRDDFIIVHDCWDQDTYPIVINKSRVHIIAVSVPSMNLYTQLQGGTKDIFQLDANYVEIAGFGFVSIGAAAIITGAIGGSYGWIHDCTFATAALSLLNAIEISGAQMGHMLIEDNFFGTNITNDGITGQLVNSIIRNNIFRGIAAKCLNLGGVEIGAILNNFFFSPVAEALTHGWAITLAAGANGGIIAGNRAASTGKNQATSCPYQDNTTEDQSTMTNGWSDNMAGEAQVKPTTE